MHGAVLFGKVPPFGINFAALILHLSLFPEYFQRTVIMRLVEM
jgi:hypothetical protein